MRARARLPVPGRDTTVTILESLGWNSFFEAHLDRKAEPDLVPLRVVEEQRGSYLARGEGGTFFTRLAGGLRHAIENGEATPPGVGDWVMARVPDRGAESGEAHVQRVLPRRTKFSRKEAGIRSVEQVIAANVDTVFLVQSLNHDLNVRRLERYLALLWESGAEPVVVLSKADLCDDPAPIVESVERAAHGVTVHVVRALEEGGLDPLRAYVKPGRTVALVGSSGVGKSTIVNRFAGEELLATREIRDDDRGRHTTTARHLVLLRDGGMLLDTPGMRTLLMWEGEDGLSQTFQDVEAVAARCRFSDCQHQTEPGCAVQEAIETGELDAARFRSYLKLQREIIHQAAKTDARVRRAEVDRWKKIHREARQRPDKRAL